MYREQDCKTNTYLEMQQPNMCVIAKYRKKGYPGKNCKATNHGQYRRNKSFSEYCA